MNKIQFFLPLQTKYQVLKSAITNLNIFSVFRIFQDSYVQLVITHYHIFQSLIKFNISKLKEKKK